MTYDLFIGDRAFSSWSMRGWLMLDSFGLPYQVHTVGLYTGTMVQDLQPLAPARLVPTLRLPDQTVVGESLAMAETLAERHPEAHLWPKEAPARATARWLCAEMTSSFVALRSECPMQLFRVWDGFKVSSAVSADLTRIETLWQHARRFADDGDWLFGSWSLADVFYAPVAARIVGYDLPVSDAARAYCLRVLSRSDVQDWRREALKVSYDPMPYDQNLPHRPWPV